MVSVFWTVDEPSGCCVVVWVLSVLLLSPVSVVVVDWVRVVVVDFGGVLLPQAASTLMAKNAKVVVKREKWLIADHCANTGPTKVPSRSPNGRDHGGSRMRFCVLRAISPETAGGWRHPGCPALRSTTPPVRATNLR